MQSHGVAGDARHEQVVLDLLDRGRSEDDPDDQRERLRERYQRRDRARDDRTGDRDELKDAREDAEEDRVWDPENQVRDRRDRPDDDAEEELPADVSAEQARRL